MIRTRDLLIVLAGASLVTLLFGWFASEVFEGETMAFDNAVREYIHSHSSPTLTWVMIELSVIGSPVVVTLVAAAACIFFLYKRLGSYALLVAITGVVEVVLNSVLKLFYSRPRPAAYFDYPLPASFSFPSGHAFGAFCVYGLLGILFSSLLKSRTLALTVRVATVLLVLLIGGSRIYLGAHYPTDVFAGYLLGAIVVTVALSLHGLPRRKAL